MKTALVKTLGSLFLTLFFVGGTLAQEKLEKDGKTESQMHIKVIKDGKTVLDSTFQASGDFDKKMVNKLIEKYSGDDVQVEWQGAAYKDISYDVDGKVAKNVVLKLVATTEDEGQEEYEYTIDVDANQAKVIEMDKGMVWVDEDDSNVVMRVKNLDRMGNLMFFSDKKARKELISLDKMSDENYKLEINSDELEPIVIEVFNSEGKRLFKKRVKNFYGRFLQNVELEDNESTFFTVKVTQGDKEIISEFEFK